MLGYLNDNNKVSNKHNKNTENSDYHDNQIIIRLATNVKKTIKFQSSEIL